MRDQSIYHDNGAAFGRRTRFFRNAPDNSGVQWIYGVDYAGGSTDWLCYMATGGHETIASLKTSGMFLSRLDNGCDFEPVAERQEYRSELTPIGEQLVIPGCERNLAPAAKQLSLFG